LEEGDSLRVLANLSICDSWLIEENLFIKREGKVFLSSTNEGEFVDSAEMKLSEVEYIKCESDTLTFEYLFSKLGDERRERTGNSLSMFSLSIRTDTVRFYSLGLKDAMRMVDHYTQIKRCLYPNIELYQPVEIPLQTKEVNLPTLRAIHAPTN
jgi:hypothetical protein